MEHYFISNHNKVDAVRGRTDKCKSTNVLNSFTLDNSFEKYYKICVLFVWFLNVFVSNSAISRLGPKTDA